MLNHIGHPTLDTPSIDDCQKNQLAHARCVLYLGCQTAVDCNMTGIGPIYNLLDSTYNKGAHFVFGFTDILYISDVNDFMAGFLSGVNNENIFECLRLGVAQAGSDVTLSNGTTGSLPYDLLGDYKQFL